MGCCVCIVVIDPNKRVVMTSKLRKSKHTSRLVNYGLLSHNMIMAISPNILEGAVNIAHSSELLYEYEADRIVFKPR